MNRQKIAAGIVTYNPDIARFRECLSSVSLQAEKIIVCDNASGNVKEIRMLIREFPKTVLVRARRNTGIAKALNQIFRRAEEEGYDWVLTLDDDSVCGRDMLELLCRYITEEGTGIVCPVAVDRRMAESDQEQEKQIREKLAYPESCITAGSLTSVAAWKAVGGFDEYMFIDFVDIEFCKRLRNAGYQIVQVCSARVYQQYGNIKGSFRLFGRRWYRFDYSPVRIYYSVRNQIYYMKKHRKTLSVSRQILYLTGYIGKRLVFEHNRAASMKAVLRGIRDGCGKKVIPAGDHTGSDGR